MVRKGSPNCFKLSQTNSQGSSWSSLWLIIERLFPLYIAHLKSIRETNTNILLPACDSLLNGKSSNILKDEAYYIFYLHFFRITFNHANAAWERTKSWVHYPAVCAYSSLERSVAVLSRGGSRTKTKREQSCLHCAKHSLSVWFLFLFFF